MKITIDITKNENIIVTVYSKKQKSQTHTFFKHIPKILINEQEKLVINSKTNSKIHIKKKESDNDYFITIYEEETTHWEFYYTTEKPIIILNDDEVEY